MNIEEARSKLISFIDFYNKKPKEENRKFKMLQVDNIDIESIETLLTAYEKEKEKREKLEYEAEEAEEYIKELKKYIEKYKIRIPMPEEYYNRENWGEEITIAQKEYIAVDKIKAKIEEVNAEELNLAFIISGVEYKEAITNALQSLLEKE